MRWRKVEVKRDEQSKLCAEPVWARLLWMRRGAVLFHGS